MIGDGTCAFVSICLGADRKKDAHTGIGNAIVLSVAAGTALMIALKSFRIYLCLLPLATVNKGTFIYLQSLGEGAGIDGALSDPRGGARSRIRTCASRFLRARRRAVFDAGIRFPDLCHRDSADPENI